MPWGTPEEIERRRRIRVSVWAYAYECLNESLVSDERFDEECKLIDPPVSTGHPALDRFFSKDFSAFTGQWVHKHPEKAKLAAYTRRVIDRLSKPLPEPPECVTSSLPSTASRSASPSLQFSLAL